MSGRAWRALRADPPALGGLVFLAAIVLLSLAAPVLPLQSVTAMSLARPAQPPSADHWLGTDSFGRDLLARLVWGARVSLLVAAGSVALGGAAGVVVGLVAGYRGGWLDRVAMRTMDALFTFPSILLAIALIGSLGKGLGSVVIALGVVYTPSFARQARAETLAAKGREFVQAAEALGAGATRVLVRHVLPNIMSPLVVRASAFFAFAILAEASLSFLGLGAQPPTPTWGGMLSEARPFLQSALWHPFVPGLAIMLTVLAASFAGDGLADAFDPRRSTSRRT